MFGRKVHSKDGDIASAETEKEVALQRARLFDTPVREIVRQEIELPNDEDGLGWACGIKLGVGRSSILTDLKIRFTISTVKGRYMILALGDLNGSVIHT